MADEKRKKENGAEDGIAALVQYGIDCGLIPPEERSYTANLLLEVMGLTGFSGAMSGKRASEQEVSGQEAARGERLCSILRQLVDDACARGVIPDTGTHRDLFDTKLMGCLTPRPGQVIEKFRRLYDKSPRQATDYFYGLSQDSDYIRRYRISRDERWTVNSVYGCLDITINLSKPEKDPRAIAMAAAAPKEAGAAYPRCQLCEENQGYAGRLDHPARQTLRTIPMTLGKEQWFLQYSPYVYYREHCIAFCGEHRPMKISRESFVRLLDFIDMFPHYFIGSNADLPIVGGSILTHDHFQGGQYEFAMERAEIAEHVTIPGYEEVEAGIVKWPLSVLRLRSENRQSLVELASHVLDSWRDYTDEASFVYACTDGEEHNTITPIARRRDGVYELDLVLRNNITTEEHPYGVYHPHEELHPVKKENIGLIEVMGLAVLPSRLKAEMAAARKVLTAVQAQAGNVHAALLAEPQTAAHADWLTEAVLRRPALLLGGEEEKIKLLKEEIGNVFVRVLEDAGVYKWTEEGRAGFLRFLATL